MIKPKIKECYKCGCKFREGTVDYDSIFQTGYCSDCLLEKIENNEEY